MSNNTDILALIDESEQCLSRVHEINAIIRKKVASVPKSEELHNEIIESATCNTCEKKATCKEPCPKICEQLPPPTSGRGRRENQREHNVDVVEPLPVVRQSEQFEAYETCRHIFSKKQWDVICSYYRDGLSQKEVAQMLKISRASASERLTRAKARKEAHDRMMRKEYLRHGRNPNFSDET
jgi:RNA polymerase sigma factor (sigma-70 family)